MNNHIALNTELQPIAEHAQTQNGLPQWVELIPDHPHVIGRDGRSWLNETPEKIVAAFAEHGADLPIDIEHATEHKAPKGDAAPAVGWIKSLEARNRAIWGLVEWNETGKELLTSKKYRYLSPVFLYGKQTHRIEKLTSAALTNQPNLHLTALNQRQTTVEDHPMTALAICTALSLPSDADEKQIVAAITQLKDAQSKAINQAHNPSLEKFVPRADHDVALNRVKTAEAKIAQMEQTALNQQIEAEIEKALETGSITPATADYHRACCAQDGGLERFKDFVKAAPKLCEDSKLDGKKVARNTVLTDEEKSIYAKMGLTEDELQGVAQ